MNDNRGNDLEYNREKQEKLNMIEMVKEHFVKIMNSANLNNIIKKQKHPKVILKMNFLAFGVGNWFND